MEKCHTESATITHKNKHQHNQGEKVFQTYQEIKNFIMSNDKYKNIREDKVSSNVFSCCMGRRKTAYGYKWSFANVERI